MQNDMKLVPKEANEYMFEAMKIMAECMIESCGKIDVGLI